MFPECYQIFKTYVSFKAHIFRFHQESNRNKYNKSFPCEVKECNYESTILKNIFSHALMHIKNNMIIKCPMALICKKTNLFSSTIALNKHKQRYHFNHTLNISNSLGVGTTLNNLDEPSHSRENKQTSALENIYSAEYSDINQFNMSELKTQSINLFTTLYQNLEAKSFLSKSSLQILTNSIRDLNNLNTQYMFQKIKSEGIDLKQEAMEYNLFDEVLNRNTGIFRSDYSRIKYYEKNQNYVHPVKIDLIKENHMGTLVKSFFYYIPILKTLEVMLKNKSVYDMCFYQPKSKNGMYFDFCDGHIFKQNSFFKENPNALRLILFQDAFELCNPLGSSRKKHKIIGIYMVLGNLYPWLRSKLDNIQLVALCYEKDVNTFGFPAILKPIINDIKYLETTGIETCMNTMFKGTLIAMVGDNLGSHQIGGFLQLFNTNSYFCRYCYCKEFSNPNYNEVLKLRSKFLYEIDADTAEALDTPFNGIKSSSALNDLNFYHVCNPGLPPCLAHDLFEGVVQVDLMLIINKLVKDKCFSYELINSRVKKLSFVSNEKINLPFIRKADKLTGTVSQNTLLLNIFPLLALNLVKMPNEYWNLMQLLRKICNLCLAVQLSIGQISVLRELLFEYIEYRKKLFPNEKLKPKHHYILHYPYLIKQFGPLRHLWTLRFEGKHSYFKNVIRHSPNFKNVLLSLSKKHQLLQSFCYSQNCLFNNNIYAKQSEILNETADLSTDFKHLIDASCTFKGVKFVSEDVEYKSVNYKKGMFVCVGIIEEGFSLCAIQKILIDATFTSLYFIGENRKIYFDEDLGFFWNVKI